MNWGYFARGSFFIRGASRKNWRNIPWGTAGGPVVSADDETSGQQIYIGPADGRLSVLEQGEQIVTVFVEHEPVKHIDFRLDVVFNEPQILDREPMLPTMQQMVGVVDKLVLSFEPVLV